MSATCGTSSRCSQPATEATRVSPRHSGGSVRLYRSTDRGESFDTVFTLGDYGGYLLRVTATGAYTCCTQIASWSIGDSWTQADATISASGPGGGWWSSRRLALRCRGTRRRRYIRSDDRSLLVRFSRGLLENWAAIVDPTSSSGVASKHVSHDGGASRGGEHMGLL